MIRFQCDKCDKALEVEDNQAGTKVSCPNCGDINIVPRPARVIEGNSAPAPGAPAIVDRAAQAGFPPALGPEQELRIVRPAFLRARPLRVIGLILLAVCGAAAAVFFLVSNPRELAPGVVCAVVAVGALVVLLWWKAATLEAGLRITTKRTVERTGFFSKATTEVMHADIRNFQVSQTLWERLWNVGTIGISSAADESIEIVMKHVPRPESVRELIDLYRPI